MAIEGVSVDGELWRKKQMIGYKSFGTVYLASRKPKHWVGSHLALMAVKSAELSVSGSLQMERKILRNFACCPYIIHCFREEITTGEKGEKVYNLVLEYASGGSLRDLIKKSGGVGLPELDVRCYTRSILRGIKLVHDRGFAHLDIKPDNILLMRQRHSVSTTATTQFMAKICDFGLAKKVSTEQSNKKKRRRGKLSPYFRGTPMYLSPEAIVEGEQGTPSDIWGIGCVVLEMLTGKPVWDRKKDWKTKEFLRKIGYEFKIPEIPSDISDEAKEFLSSCFVRNDRARLSADTLLKLPFVKSIGDDDDDDDDDDEGEEEEEEEEEDCNIKSNDALIIGSCLDDFYFRSLLKISKSLNVKEEVGSIEPNNITSMDSEEEGEPIENYEEEEEEEPVEDYEEEEEEPIEEEEEPTEDYEEEEDEEEQEPIEDCDCIHSFSRVMMTATEDQNADAKDLEIPDHKRRRIDD